MGSPYDNIDVWRDALEQLFQASHAGEEEPDADAVSRQIDDALAVLYIPDVTRVTIDDQAIGFSALHAQMAAVAASIAAGANIEIEVRDYARTHGQFRGTMRVIAKRPPSTGMPPLRMVDVHMTGELDEADGRAATFNMRSARVDLDDSESD